MGLPRDAGALLLIEVDGDGEMLPRYLEKIREIIAPLNIKASLKVKDGDFLKIAIIR